MIILAVRINVAVVFYFKLVLFSFSDDMGEIAMEGESCKLQMS